VENFPPYAFFFDSPAFLIKFNIGDLKKNTSAEE
jgi:hypothetical protein